jgi:hypothetical protein
VCTTGEPQMSHVTPTHLQTQNAHIMNDEPSFFSLSGNNNLSAITSDNFSFLDMEANELSTKGGGGMKQLHNYSTLDNDQRIMIVEEEDEKTNINKQKSEVSIESLQNDRESQMKNLQYNTNI